MFVLMGVAAGILGSAFIKLNIRATQLRARFVPPRKPWLRLLEVPCIYPPYFNTILYHWCHPEERCSDGLHISRIIEHIARICQNCFATEERQCYP